MSQPTRHIPKPPPGRLDESSVTETLAHRMMYSIAKDEFTASDFDVYQGLAYAVRDRLMERWFRTQDAYYRRDAKRVYYLSLEFLMGRALVNNIISLGAEPAYRGAIAKMGFDLDALQAQEWDAGLGNGGLGRLAACILDAAATLALPFYGYGIRYEYGIFQQRIHDGFQVEYPDNWLRYGNPWEIPRPEALFPVHFHGRTESYQDEEGRDRVRWVDTQDVWAMAYDTPVVGFRNGTVNTLRLWAAKSSREFDLSQFNAGEYVRAVEDKTHSENISKVLYPPDDKYAGKELRLKQQYFFVSATLQDVVRRFRKREHRWEELPDKVALQLNDTHPALAVPELMRVLVDQQRLDWGLAWDLTQQVCGYTNHTVLPEALEVWPTELMRRLLPRHMEIVEEIDRRFRQAVQVRHPGDEQRVRRMAICEGGSVRMANLAFVGSHKINGVAALHSRILQQSTFAELHAFFPGRLENKTNGITPRRWLLDCNPGLAGLISEAIGDRWTTDLDELQRLRPLATDAAFRERFGAIKQRNKQAFAVWLQRAHGLRIDPELLFDVQVKRFHEYKRQLLNALHAIVLYHRIRDGAWEGAPRAVLIGGKAAPGYAVAKLVIKLVNSIAGLVDGDPATRGKLQVAFLPNYCVSMAEVVFPACELSQQISTAGTEASGTGNMKAALGGALTMGTLDGANVEIREEVGADNIFIFGHTAEQIAELRPGYRPASFIADDAELARAIETIRQLGPELFAPLVQALVDHDRYFHCADFGSYCATQRRAEAVWRKPQEWNRMAILNVAGMGHFSIDRTVREYAADIWHAVAVPVPGNASDG